MCLNSVDVEIQNIQNILRQFPLKGKRKEVSCHALVKRANRWLTRTLCCYCLGFFHSKYSDPSVWRVQGHFAPFPTGNSQDNCMICWESNILIIRWHWSEQPQALLESLLETEWPLTFVSSKPHRGRKPKVGCFLGSLSCSASEGFTVKTPSICSG